jgi:hypothetical protein
MRKESKRVTSGAKVFLEGKIKAYYLKAEVKRQGETCNRVRARVFLKEGRIKLHAE